jgi:hypothetical protein
MSQKEQKRKNYFKINQIINMILLSILNILRTKPLAFVRAVLKVK